MNAYKGNFLADIELVEVPEYNFAFTSYRTQTTALLQSYFLSC